MDCGHGSCCFKFSKHNLLIDKEQQPLLQELFQSWWLLGLVFFFGFFFGGGGVVPTFSLLGREILYLSYISHELF